MKLFKNNVDERQELEFLRMERIGFWIMFWGLFIAIIVQPFFDGFSPSQIAGEFIVFLAGGIILTIGCIRKGLWSRCLKINTKTNVIISIAAAVAVVIISSVFRYAKFPPTADMPGFVSVVMIALPAGFTFALSFGVLSFFGAVTKRRKEKLESEYEAADDEAKGRQ